MKSLEQIVLSETDEGGIFIVEGVDQRLEVSVNKCGCNFFISMSLPCKHIFAARNVSEFDLFDEDLCNKRWTSSYFWKHQRKLRSTFGKESSAPTNTVGISVKKEKPKTVWEKGAMRCKLPAV